MTLGTQYELKRPSRGASFPPLIGLACFFRSVIHSLAPRTLCRVEQWSARLAHNQKVVGSNPTSAPNFKGYADGEFSGVTGGLRAPSGVLLSDSQPLFDFTRSNKTRGGQAAVSFGKVGLVNGQMSRGQTGSLVSTLCGFESHPDLSRKLVDSLMVPLRGLFERDFSLRLKSVA
jgi:hypothetical protein